MLSLSFHSLQPFALTAPTSSSGSGLHVQQPVVIVVVVRIHVVGRDTVVAALAVGAPHPVVRLRDGLDCKRIG